MQTVIIYNGVRLKDVLTEPIHHEVAKDGSGVDQIGVRTVIDCTAVVHTAAQDHSGVKVASNFASGLGALLDKLTKDRRAFRMQIGTSVLYDVRPGAAEPSAPSGTITANIDAMDIDQGPKPSVDVLKIVSGNSAMIRFRVEFVLPNCGDDKGKNDLSNSGIVNFRFWIHDDVDCRTWLTTRVYAGRLRVAHKNISPHKLARQIVIPPLQPGFKREVIQLHEDPSGLELDFVVQDKEFLVAPPWSPNTNSGATDWRGSFQCSTSDFATSHSELNFELTGPKGTSKRDLFLIGLQIVASKTHYVALSSSGSTAGQAFLEQFAVREELAENSVAFVCRLRHTGRSEDLIGIFAIGGVLEIGQPLGNLNIGYDQRKAFHPGPSATLAGVFRSLLQTPCNPQKMPTDNSGASAYALGYRSSSGSGAARSVIPAPLPVSASPASRSHLAAMYLDYRMHSEIELVSGKIALPTGASSSGGDTLAFVQLHQPVAYRNIDIDAARLTQAPELPRPNTDFQDQNGIRHTMIGQADVKSGAPQLSADSRKRLFTAKMAMRYGLSRPPRSSEPIPVGALPYQVTNFSDPSRRLPPAIFVDPKTLLS